MEYSQYYYVILLCLPVGIIPIAYMIVNYLFPQQDEEARRIIFWLASFVILFAEYFSIWAVFGILLVSIAAVAVIACRRSGQLAEIVEFFVDKKAQGPQLETDNN